MKISLVKVAYTLIVLCGILYAFVELRSPNGIPALLEKRQQVREYEAGNIDVLPTVLEAAGLPEPTTVNGVKQTPLVGVSMRYTFEDAKAPTRKVTQYYEMLGNRGIWHKGWKAVTEHGPFSGLGHFDKDRWELCSRVLSRRDVVDRLSVPC